MLDARRGVLQRDGEPGPRSLRSQSFRVLQYLVEHRDQVISVDRIVADLWGKKFSGPQSNDVAQCIKDIRDALHPKEAHGWLIRTVPRRGYQFMGEVVTAESEPELRAEGTMEPAHRLSISESDVSARPAAVEPPPLVPRIPRWPLLHARHAGTWLMAGLLIAMLVGGGAAWLKQGLASRPATLTMMAAPTVAVLLGSAESEGLRVGLQPFVDEIAAQLRLVPRGYDLQIIPLSLASSGVASPEVEAKAFGVRYLANVSSRLEADGQRLTVRLIEAPTGWQVWSQQYMRPASGAQQIGGSAPRIAREITVAIRTAENTRPLPARVEAGHLTLQARSLLEGERGPASSREARILLDKALALEPNNVMALQGGARARVIAVANGWIAPTERSKLLEEAEDAVARVIAVDKSTVGAFVLRGVIERLKNNLDGSLAALEHARSLRPEYVLVHAELGRTLMDLGRPREALTSIETSIAAGPGDPASWGWHRWAGMSAALLGDFQASLDHLLKARELNRAHIARPWLAIAYLKLGQRERASEVVQEMLRHVPKFTVDSWIRAVSRGDPAIAKRIAPLAQALLDLGVPR